MSVLSGSYCKFSNIFNGYRHVVCQRVSVTCIQPFSSKISIEEKLGLKPKPKKPLTIFLRFKEKILPNLIQKNPKAGNKDLVRLAAEEWKKVDEKMKHELQEEYKVEWLKYQDARKDYDKSLSPGDREEIESSKKLAKTVKEKRELKKKREELGRPKKPPTPFVLFVMSKLSERGETPYKDWQSKLAKMWSEMSEGEKEKFVKVYKEDMDNYKQKLSEWEKKMAKEGQNAAVWR